jgi:hypothetical protein
MVGDKLLLVFPLVGMKNKVMVGAYKSELD